MSLYAVMNKNSAVPVYRIDTDQKTDAKINTIFKDQLKAFKETYTNVLPFDAGYTPSPNECHSIDKFNEGDLLFDAVNRSTAVPKWDDSIGLDNVTALFLSPDYPNNPDCIAIQKFNKKQILETSRFLWLSNNVFSLKDSLGFSLDDKLVAVIEKKTIKFKSLTNLRSIFDMNPYFATATKADLDTFSLHAHFEVPQGFNLDSIADNVIRKKVALINKSKILDTQSVSKIKVAAKKLNFTLNTSGSGGTEKIIMPSVKKEIKELLDFLDEDYFNSELTNTRFRSNSKRIA